MSAPACDRVVGGLYRLVDGALWHWYAGIGLLTVQVCGGLDHSQRPDELRDAIARRAGTLADALLRETHRRRGWS